MNWPQSTIAHDTDPVGAQALTLLLESKTLASVHYVSVTGSTNEDAKTFASQASLSPQSSTASSIQSSFRSSSIVPRLFLADRQTDGRGRRGRTWLSDENSLTLSLLICQPLDSRLSLAVGVAVAEAIESHDPERRIDLKWPNDLILDGGKLAGILVETISHSGSADLQKACPQIIGIGINLGSPPSLDSLQSSDDNQGLASLAAPPAGLHSDRHRYQWLPEIVTSLVHWIEILATNPEAVIHAFSQRCVLSGRTIRFQYLGQEQTGICRGIRVDGRLNVEIDGKLVAVESGEVHRVR